VRVLGYVKQHPDILHSDLVRYFVEADANTNEHMANRTVQQKIINLKKSRLLTIRYEGKKKKHYSIAVIKAEDIDANVKSHIKTRDEELKLVHIMYPRLRTWQKVTMALNCLLRLISDLNYLQLMWAFGKHKKEHNRLEKHIQNNIKNIYGVIIHDKEYSMVLPWVLQAFSVGEAVGLFPLSTMLLERSGRS
jgi:hypothetical protein